SRKVAGKLKGFKLFSPLECVLECALSLKRRLFGSAAEVRKYLLAVAACVYAAFKAHRYPAVKENKLALFMLHFFDGVSLKRVLRKALVHLVRLVAPFGICGRKPELVKHAVHLKLCK